MFLVQTCILLLRHLHRSSAIKNVVSIGKLFNHARVLCNFGQVLAMFPDLPLRKAGCPHLFTLHRCHHDRCSGKVCFLKEPRVLSLLRLSHVPQKVFFTSYDIDRTSFPRPKESRSVLVLPTRHVRRFGSRALGLSSCRCNSERRAFFGGPGGC